ncbi:MAG: SWIM zinc finger family protein, partial [Bryobacteraceae bacterium]
MARWDSYSGFYPPSRPREAKGGIRAQSQRGVFGESWWAKRWIAVLESFDIGARLQRGRRYARSGQVLSIQIEKGEITAQVQGSRPKPYRIRIKVKALAKEKWPKVAQAVSQQALFASKLLAGQMPHQMEEVVSGEGASLFPARSSDLETECSCPDWSNPCKHIAAVYY